jgi:hypothetical protein
MILFCAQNAADELALLRPLVPFVELFRSHVDYDNTEAGVRSERPLQTSHAELLTVLF